MKKTFSKTMAVILTVCMLVSVFASGISATTDYMYGAGSPPVSLTISEQAYSPVYSYYYPTIITASLTDPYTYYKNGTLTWSVTGSNASTVYAERSGMSVLLTTTSLNPVTVSVSATVKPTGGYSDITSEVISVTVYPSSYYWGYPGLPGLIDYPYWWGYDWTSMPYWWQYDWYGTYPYASNVVYVAGVPYPWCGHENSSDCTSTWCIHNIMRSSVGITYDTTYCSPSCGYCGNPFNHHTVLWFINGGKDTSSTTPPTSTPAKDVKLPSAIERLEEFLKSQEEGASKDTAKDEKKTPSKWVNLYNDVTVKSWYYEFVKFASENGYMSGNSTFEFGINTAVSRSEFAETLGKFAQVTKSSPAEYVKWAVEKGFLAESEDTKITKEEAVNAMYLYVKSLGKKVDAGSAKTEYSDSDKISENYKDAMDWAISNGIIGISSNKINPDDPLVKTRLAQMLYNIDKIIG